MRPVKLTIKGLNSFAEEQVIDFEKLTEAGLFGVFGPTGSGKSTIVDAMTMALYGEMSRYDNDKKSKQCINAGCDTMSVCFEFEIGREGAAIRYGALRSYKKKTDKNMENLLCRFYKIDGQETVILADKSTKMKEEVTALIGLSYDDFSRSVVLPQGKFSDFLLLGNKERRDMLERIFGLEKYGDNLNRKIRGAANNCKNQMALTESKLEFYDGLNREKIALEQKNLNETAAALEALKVRLEEITKEHQYLVRRKELQNRRNANREALTQQRERLQKAGVEEGALKKLYEDAYRAKEEQYPLLIQKMAGLNQAIVFGKEADQLEGQRKLLLTSYTGKKKELDELCKKISKLESQTGSLQEELRKIMQEKQKASPAPEYRQGLQEAYSLWRQEEEEEKKRQILCEKLKAGRTVLEKGKKDIEDASKELHKLREQLRTMAVTAFALARYRQKELDALEERLRQAGIQNMASDLARDLHEGVPCPVCGSVDHPGKTSAKVSETDVEVLRKKRDTLHKENQSLEVSLMALSKSLAGLGEKLEFRQEEAEEADGKEGKAITQAELEKTAERYSRLVHGLSNMRHSIVKDEALLAELEAEAKGTGQAKEKNLLQLQRYMQELKTERLNEAYLQMLRDDKERSRWEVQEGKHRLLLEENEKNLTAFKNRQSGLAVELESLRISGLEKKEALESCRGKIKDLTGGQEPALLTELQKKVQTETDLLLQREESLKKKLDILWQRSKTMAQELAALEKQEETLEELWKENYVKLPSATDDIVTVSNALAACQEEVSQKVSLAAVLKERIGKMVKDLEVVTRLNREKKELSRRLDTLMDLAGLFEGNRFVEFVAKRQLVYIAADASRRLKKMSNGRYSLELDGTDFIMRDDGCGGIRRSPRTLSGGETFTVSLCLALALSAKIQLKNAAPLEFFFLDEGFGTLDSALLDVVMNALEGLPSEKMKVGLITHVEELKNRIPARLELVPAEPGVHGTLIFPA